MGWKGRRRASCTMQNSWIITQASFFRADPTLNQALRVFGGKAPAPPALRLFASSPLRLFAKVIIQPASVTRRLAMASESPCPRKQKKHMHAAACTSHLHAGQRLLQRHQVVAVADAPHALRKHADARGIEPLQLAHVAGHRRRHHQPAQAPARHQKALGKAVRHHQQAPIHPIYCPQALSRSWVHHHFVHLHCAEPAGHVQYRASRAQIEKHRNSRQPNTHKKGSVKVKH